VVFHQKKRPYIILKWAESQDGFIAPLEKIEKKPVWITNEFSRQLVHKWRTEEQAILVGTQTVIDDNPKLNARDWHGNNPIRIVIDQNNRIPLDNTVFDNQVKTIFITKSKNTPNKENTTFEVIDFKQNIGEQIIDSLYKHNIQSIIIEGGLQTLQTFIDANLWDEARIFIGKTTFGKGICAPLLPKLKSEKHIIDTDELLIIRNHD
jgi:diaminohydroxyphosphoribosylaminopyrimidine deaminase/5-amino-6-(5-phosphoribosylamino)uracil reductase